MATQWHDFGDGSYALTGGSNIGVVSTEGQALLIDAGLDRSVAKKALREIAAQEAELVAVLLTHGHADHFGGAAWAAQQGAVGAQGESTVPIYAPPLEGAFAAHPILEPLFLYNGAAPIAELQSKFTLAEEAIPGSQPLAAGRQTIAGLEVEVLPLAGHAPQQVGVAYAGTCYCGDAVFPTSTLERHPILFCADLDAWLETLARLPDLPYRRFVAGHGKPVAEITPLAEQTAARLRELRELTWAAIAQPREPYGVLRSVAAHYGVTFSAPQFLLLSLTTINAALASLQRAGEAEVRMEENRMLWERR